MQRNKILAALPWGELRNSASIMVIRKTETAADAAARGRGLKKPWLEKMDVSMTNLPAPVSKCSQFSDDEPYDGFDLYVAAAKAAEIIAAARGITDSELEDNFVRSGIQHAAYDVVDAAIVEIRNHPGFCNGPR
jgi:hypothetical protein